jgi:hypothetical protein
MSSITACGETSRGDLTNATPGNRPKADLPHPPGQISFPSKNLRLEKRKFWIFRKICGYNPKWKYIGLMEMTHLWKSAKSADSHSCLEKSRQETTRLSHISTGPTGVFPCFRT